MSAPPPGFNEQASNLPDPGVAAAPIHVMRGGGGMGEESSSAKQQIGGVLSTNDDKTILEAYGLTNPMITQHIPNFDDSFKQSFLQQIRSGECERKGNSITKKDCWAVTAVIRAMVQEEIRTAGTLPEMVPEAVVGIGNSSEEVRRLRNATSITDESSTTPYERPDDSETAFHELVDELGGEEAILGDSKEGSTNVTEEEVNAALATLPGVSGTESVESSRMNAQNVVNPANVILETPQNNVITRTHAESTASPASEAVASNNSYYEENPTNFRKGQYGINLNTTNNSKRVYANAVLGTKRLRIRGRNTANIKSRYNTKKQRLTNALANARRRAAEEKTAANAVRERLTRDREAAKRASEEASRIARTARTDKAIANTLAKRREKELRNAEKKAAEDARRAAVAAGEAKPSFMNRLRSVKNPFKRGGSRKTRRSTRRRSGRR